MGSSGASRSGTGGTLTTTATKTAAYAAAANELVLCDATTGTFAVTLPAAGTAGQVVAVKKLDASANVVTVQRAGSDTINAASTSLTLTLQNQAATLVSSGSGAWTVQADDMPLGQLDARFAALTGPTFTGEVVAPDVKVTGLTGATTAVRIVGGTASGAPTSGTYAVGDAVITQNGQIFVCTVAGTPGTWGTPADLRNLLTSGEETCARHLAQSSAVATSNQGLRLTYFTARKTETTANVRMDTGGTAAAATPTLCRFGLYSVDSGGGGTLVASTANDTTLFAAGNTGYTRAWSTPYSKVAGQRYALAVLVVTGAATPTFWGIGSAGLAADAGLAPRLGGLLTGQADLPSSFTDASLTATAQCFYGAVLP